MLFWCMAVCARGHGDISLEESHCGVLSFEEYLRGVRLSSFFLCVCASICVCESKRERKTKESVTTRETREKKSLKHRA